MAESLNLVQKQLGIELLVGRGLNQRKMKILPIIANFNMDGEECGQQQMIFSSSRSNSNCRICTMLSKLFYKWKHSKAITDQKRLLTGFSKSEIIDLIIETQRITYPLRDSLFENILRKQAEQVWWKKVLFNKDEMKKGNKILRLTDIEHKSLESVRLLNLKPMVNNLYDKFFGFLTNWGSQPSILPGNCYSLLFPSDRLHTLWKGNFELSFRYSSIILFLTGHKNPTDYSNNISIIDQRIIDFDIYQPSSSSSWGNKIERRIPGLSSKHNIFL